MPTEWHIRFSSFRAVGQDPKRAHLERHRLPATLDSFLQLLFSLRCLFSSFLYLFIYLFFWLVFSGFLSFFFFSIYFLTFFFILCSFCNFFCCFYSLSLFYIHQLTHTVVFQTPGLKMRYNSRYKKGFPPGGGGLLLSFSVCDMCVCLLSRPGHYACLPGLWGFNRPPVYHSCSVDSVDPN